MRLLSVIGSAILVALSARGRPEIHWIVFPSLDGLLANRRIQTTADGSGYIEDGYDFGVMWRGPGCAIYRLTWLGPLGRTDESAEPGELYLLNLGGGSVELLCVIPPTDGPRPAENVEAILGGWEDVCGAEDSVDWIRDRVWEALRADWAQPATAGEIRHAR